MPYTSVRVLYVGGYRATGKMLLTPLYLKDVTVRMHERNAGMM